MSDRVILTADLYDTRQTPPRPAIFIAGKGQSVPRQVADTFGGQYQDQDRAPVEVAKRTVPNKKRTPANKSEG